MEKSDRFSALQKLINLWKNCANMIRLAFARWQKRG